MRRRRTKNAMNSALKVAASVRAATRSSLGKSAGSSVTLLAEEVVALADAQEQAMDAFSATQLGSEGQPGGSRTELREREREVSVTLTQSHGDHSDQTQAETRQHPNMPHEPSPTDEPPSRLQVSMSVQAPAISVELGSQFLGVGMGVGFGVGDGVGAGFGVGGGVGFGVAWQHVNMFEHVSFRRKVSGHAVEGTHSLLHEDWPRIDRSNAANSNSSNDR